MANNSFVFTNYYQPLYPVSTSDGEYMNLTGLIPKEGVWSFKEIIGNYREIVDELDMGLLAGYLEKFKNGKNIFDIIHREVF